MINTDLCILPCRAEEMQLNKLSVKPYTFQKHLIFKALSQLNNVM